MHDEADFLEQLSRLRETFQFSQKWEVVPGEFVGGEKDVARTFDLFEFPKVLTGKRVLDIGAGTGCFSFECVRRGAASVTALDLADPDTTGFAALRNLLGLTNVEYLREDLRSLPRLDLGSFDIVLMLGIAPHLKDPLGAFQIVADLDPGRLFVDCPIIDYGFHVRRSGSFASLEPLSRLPLVYFAHGDHAAADADRGTWYIPNLRGLHDWIEAVGLAVTHVNHTQQQGYVIARRQAGERV